MPYQLNMIDLAEAVNDCIEDCHSVFHDVHTQFNPEISSRQLLLPARFGEGLFNVRKLADSTFSAMKFCFNNDICLTQTAPDTMFFISVNLGADMDLDFADQKQGLRIASQTLTLGHCQQEETSRTTMPVNKQMQSLTFSFSKQQLNQYLAALGRQDLTGRFDKASKMQIFERALVSTRHRYLISRLLQNPYHGVLEKLYFESIAGELLIALLESILTGGREPGTALSLSDRDKEILLVAKELLFKDLQNPPTITQLAKSVGLNENKLKKGFKVLFNNTIFKTLTEYRMQQAAELVRKRDMSIAEIAHFTGYANISKFIAAFRKIYSITPGMMRKQDKVK